MPISPTGQGITPSEGQQQQQSKSKKRRLQRSEKPIESYLSSDDESCGNSSSSSFLSRSSPASGSKVMPKRGRDRQQQITDTSSNSTASKKIYEEFLKASAGAASVKEAVELHQMMMESDNDSSSTGSDFGQLWGLSKNESNDNFETSDNNSNNNPEYESSTEDHGFESESDVGSDSSIEIVNPGGRRQRGMNARHLSGRQRRLEAARSKNTAIRLYDDEESSEGEDSSIEDDDKSSEDVDMEIIREDKDDNSVVLGAGDDGVTSSNEANGTNLKPTALVPTETEKSNNNTAQTSAPSAEAQVSTSALHNDASTELTNEKSISDIENIELGNKKTTEITSTGINGSNAKLMLDNEPRSPKVDTNSSVNHEVSKEVKTIVRRKGAAKKSTSKTTTKSNLNTESGVFDNLFCNGKDFIAWAGISDPNEFLGHSKEYSQQVNLWRKERKLPLFNDTAGYIQKLRRQVRDNIKSIAARAKKRGRRTSAITGGPKPISAINKSKKRRKNKGKSIYPSMKDMPTDGGDFMNYMEIKNIKDVFKRNDLHKYVNEWRGKRKLPLVDNERSCVANWRKWIRQNMKHPADGIAVDMNTKNNPPDEIDFSNCMKVVSSLSKRFLNSATGLPVYQFAVYDTLSTDIIYEFRVEAKPSLIPKAGNGAFLTFLGAREAPLPIEESDTAFEVETIQPLVSMDSEGCHMNLKAVGEHLQGTNKRMQYPPPTSLPPIHGSPEEKAIGASKYPWRLKPEEERFLSKYVENSEIVFSTNQIGCSVIELGRYGPFRRSDRKFQLHYDLKNFIFSNEVSEWGFDVVEDLKGHAQVADVTDDVTGMPHCVAKQNISMYVNETGGDPGLKQTVWSGQVFDREVNYFFKTEKPMKKGETIELLISYFGTYDEIRERKGYGERNKSGDVLSDDHFPSFLERNFVERYDMVEVVYEVEGIMDLYLLSEFLEKIRGNLAMVVHTFIRKLQSSSEGIRVPYVQQIIALRRLNWLKPFFLKKIESLQKKVDNSKKTDATAAQIPVLRQCAANAKSLDWASWPILMDLLDKYPNLVDGRGIDVRSKFREEVTEDICYGIKTPTNPSEALVQKALEASKAIRNPKNINTLDFDTGIWKRYALNNRGGISKEPRGTKCLMTLANDCQGPEKRLPAPFILRGNSAMDQRHILKNIHKPWYLVRQILFVTDTFAKRCLPDDKSYSFEILRQKLGVSSEASSLFLKRDIELDLESSLFYGKEFDSIYSTGNKLTPFDERSSRKKSMNTAPKTKAMKPKIVKTQTSRIVKIPIRRLLFWDILIKRLEESGWNIERGARSNDWYLLPPGVSRGKGVKSRVDFFDSAPLVINCLKTDSRYCNQPVIKSIMEEYLKCQKEFENMKLSKSKELKILSSKDMVQYLRKKVSTTVNKSPTPDGIIQNTGVATVKLVFRTEHLGLMLQLRDGQVFVKGVKNTAFEKQLNAGDAVIAVGDSSTRNKSLNDVCEIIRGLGRPLTITFERKMSSP